MVEASSSYLSRCGRGVSSRAGRGARHAVRREEAAGLDSHPEDDGCRPLRASRASSAADEARVIAPGEESRCGCGGPPLALGESRIVEVRPWVLWGLVLILSTPRGAARQQEGRPLGIQPLTSLCSLFCASAQDEIHTRAVCCGEKKTRCCYGRRTTTCPPSKPMLRKWPGRFAGGP